jgi:hypothetical protein
MIGNPQYGVSVLKPNRTAADGLVTIIDKRVAAIAESAARDSFSTSLFL